MEVEDCWGTEGRGGRGGGVGAGALGLDAEDEALEEGAIEPAVERAAVVGRDDDVLEVARGRAARRGVDPRGLERRAEERPPLAARDKHVHEEHCARADRQHHAKHHGQHVQHRWGKSGGWGVWVSRRQSVSPSPKKEEEKEKRREHIRRVVKCKVFFVFRGQKNKERNIKEGVITEEEVRKGKRER